MKIYKTNKIVLSLKNSPEQFLNGITSNSLDQPRNAFVNIHGKIVATFDQVKISDNEFYIILEKDYIQQVLEHIDKFAKLSGAEIVQLDKKVYFQLEEPLEKLSDEDVEIPQKKGYLIVSDQEKRANVTEEEFTIFRLKNNIPLLGVDYKDDFLLNIGEDEFVSFTKGCFLGQEPISKVHNRSKPTWKLVVCYENECDEEVKLKMTSKIKDPETHKLKGFAFVRNN